MAIITFILAHIKLLLIEYNIAGTAYINIVDMFGICKVFPLTRSFTIKTIDMKIYVKKGNTSN